MSCINAMYALWLLVKAERFTCEIETIEEVFGKQIDWTRSVQNIYGVTEDANTKCKSTIWMAGFYNMSTKKCALAKKDVIWSTSTSNSCRKRTTLQTRRSNRSYQIFLRQCTFLGAESESEVKKRRKKENIAIRVLESKGWMDWEPITSFEVVIGPGDLCSRDLLNINGGPSHYSWERDCTVRKGIVRIRQVTSSKEIRT